MKITSFLRRQSVFTLALLASALVHAVVLSIRFVSPDTFNRLFTNMPLEIILVNAETEEKPQDAKALAQSAMAGGGEAQSGRATSPLPYSALTNIGEDAENLERKDASSRAAQNNLLAQLREQVAELPPLDPNKKQHSAEEIAQEEKRLNMLRLLAQIERDVKTENERPRKRFVSPSTHSSVLAIYLNNVRSLIAHRGTENFPTQNGNLLFGKLIMEVLINHDGSLVTGKVVRSSGNPALDRRAEAIVYAAAPFGHFSQDMRKQTDQLGFFAQFEFLQDSTLRMEMRELENNDS